MAFGDFAQGMSRVAGDITAGQQQIAQQKYQQQQLLLQQQQQELGRINQQIALQNLQQKTAEWNEAQKQQAELTKLYADPIGYLKSIAPNVQFSPDELRDWAERVAGSRFGFTIPAGKAGAGLGVSADQERGFKNDPRYLAANQQLEMDKTAANTLRRDMEEGGTGIRGQLGYKRFNQDELDQKQREINRLEGYKDPKTGQYVPGDIDKQNDIIRGVSKDWGIPEPGAEQTGGGGAKKFPPPGSADDPVVQKISANKTSDQQKTNDQQQQQPAPAPTAAPSQPTSGLGGLVSGMGQALTGSAGTAPPPAPAAPPTQPAAPPSTSWLRDLITRMGQAQTGSVATTPPPSAPAAPATPGTRAPLYPTFPSGQPDPFWPPTAPPRKPAPPPSRGAQTPPWFRPLDPRLGVGAPNIAGNVPEVPETAATPREPPAGPGKLQRPSSAGAVWPNLAPPEITPEETQMMPPAAATPPRAPSAQVAQRPQPSSGYPGGPSSERAKFIREAPIDQVVARVPQNRQWLVPIIRQKAQQYGVDPDIAVRVAFSEGLSNPSGDFEGGKPMSGGVFQLYTGKVGGGGLGTDYEKERHRSVIPGEQGYDEADQIDWVMRYASKHGWGHWHGPKRVWTDSDWVGIRREAEPATVSAGG